MNSANARTLPILLIALTCALTAPAPFAALFPVDGFEDDVDLAVAPNREFLVVASEGDGVAPPALLIFNLDALTGAAIGLGPATTLPVKGFENGVDPIITNTAGGLQVVIVPTETEDGSGAEVLVMSVGAAGLITAGPIVISLGNLGFEDDVDAVATRYPDPDPGAIIPLEREDGSAAGILAIDLSAAVARFGACTVVANIVAPGTSCAVEEFEPAANLPGFLDAVDGLAYTLPDRARFAIPVQAADGTGSNLAFFDFDFGAPPGPPPAYLGFVNVKAVNNPLARKTPFPGFERDVDIALLSAGPGDPANCLDPIVFCFPLLVPVEDKVTDRGDLYLVSGCTGVAYWRYQFDNLPGSPSIPGYEEAVDVVPWCEAEGDADFDLLLVPGETEKGTDANLLVVDLMTGTVVSDLEGANPGATVLGWEKGVEPVVWTNFFAFVPEDDERGSARIRSIDTVAAIVAEATISPFGFERGVDPFVMPRPHPDRTLYVPMERQDQGDADLIILPAPPGLGGISFEAMNPGVLVPGYERDVDPTRVNRLDGYGHIYVAEESATGGAARLRVHPIPTQETVLLVLPAEGQPTSALLPKLFLVRPGGTLAEETTVLGYEMGLDTSSPIGDTLMANPPATSTPLSGLDADTDNTLTMYNSYTGNLDGDALADALDCAYLEGGVFAPPSEVTGVGVAHALPASTATVTWDSQDLVAGEDTCYDIASGLLSDLHADAGYADVACWANELADLPRNDARALASKAGYYYLVRAQNLCGNGTYGPPALDLLAPCP